MGSLRRVTRGFALTATLTACHHAGPDPMATTRGHAPAPRETCAASDQICRSLQSRTPTCPRLETLPRVCVPLPDSGLAPAVIAPGSQCAPGFFASSKADVRQLFVDTLLIKETGDNSGERPVMTLFLGKERALLLDTGNNTLQVEQVVAPLLEGRPVEVINTHLHGDHIGRNAQFDVIAIATPEVETHCAVSGYDRNASASCNNAAPYDPPDDQELFSFRNFRVVRVVRDGHRIELGGREITVLATPGHSETSVTLIDPIRRLVFTGDTLYPGSDPPLVHPKTGSSFSLYRQTAERYRDLAPGTAIVIGAHGEGVMPARSLEAFAGFVTERADDPNGPDAFVDPLGCASGNFVMGNDPAPP